MSVTKIKHQRQTIPPKGKCRLHPTGKVPSPIGYVTFMLRLALDRLLRQMREDIMIKRTLADEISLGIGEVLLSIESIKIRSRQLRLMENQRSLMGP